MNEGFSLKPQAILRKLPLEVIEKDYVLMESMLFREAPFWEVILRTIGQFENEFNKIES